MNTLDKSNRIWEIDAARGIGILCVVVMHAFVDLNDFSTITVVFSPFFYFIKQYAGSFFVFLSGMAAYFSSKSVKRGIIVMACGFVLTALTYWLFLSGREPQNVLIQWGVLHLIGFCMIIYPLLKKLPYQALLAIGVVILIAGYGFVLKQGVGVKWLFPIGLRYYFFFAWDYFPIIPQLGWFMLGTGVSKIVYKDKKSKLDWNTDNFLIKFFCWCGRNSLQIYMAHMILFYIIAKKI